MKMLKCTKCNSDLELSVGYTGADWNTEAGEGSGYDYEVNLTCTECAATYTIGHIKNINDFTEVIDKYKCVRKGK